MRVSNVENDIKHVIAGLNKVQGTMSMISRTAWSIITCIGLAALFWAARELVTR